MGFLPFFLVVFFATNFVNADFKIKDRFKPHTMEDKDVLIVVKHPEFKHASINGKRILYPGMFSVFNTVIGSLVLFDQRDFAGIVVDFEDKGLYFDSKKGPNWWDYYCEPIVIHKRQYLQRLVYEFEKCSKLAYNVEFLLNRERANQLISRYIHFKPIVAEAVAQFVDAHFLSQPVIGIHYRGTDKDFEAPKIAYENVAEEIEEYITSEGLSDYLIFIATDEEKFLKHMEKVFPDRVISIQAERASDDKPLHYNTKDPFQQGLESIVDCLLLSKTDVLFRTSSNLSLWSTYLNPQLKVIMLSERY